MPKDAFHPKRLLGIATMPEKALMRTRIWRPQPLPDFLVIGVPRSGTTWLHAMLKCHAQLHLAQPKEVHYFDGHFGRPIRDYTSRFHCSDGCLAGEVTPDYIYLPRRRIRFIEAIMPDVRLVALLRHPVDRAWSDAVRIKIKRKRRKPDEVPLDEVVALLGAPWFARRSEYASALQNWLGVFPRESLFIGIYDDIANRPLELLNEILQHIGVPPHEGVELPLLTRFNANPGRLMPPGVRASLQVRYGPELDRLRGLLGAVVSAWD